MAKRWRLPTVDTQFWIDMEWWDDQDRDIRVYMRELLCDSCRSEYAESVLSDEEVDWVDEETGEVTRVDALWHTIRTCCSVKPGYVTPTTPMVDALFRTFLANGNMPLTVRELYERLDRRPPKIWLRVLSSKVQMGIRPVYD